MQYFSADFIFDGTQFLPPGVVVVVNDEGVIQDIIQADNSLNVQHCKGLLMPGIINAHCHLELSHMRGVIPEHTGLVEFLMRINQHRANYTEEYIQHAIQLAEEEMIQHGIVAVGDICNTTYSLPQKKLQQIRYHSFIECVGLLDSNALQRFEISKSLLDEFNQLNLSSLVLHAPYSVSDSLIRLVDDQSAGKITTIHNQECDDENRLFETGTGSFLKLFESILHDSSFFKSSGQTSLQTFLPKFKIQNHLLLVHNTVSSKADIQFANTSGKKIFWCLCPNANLYIEGKLPNIPLMIEQGCNIVLGTDSLASNHHLNVLDEILTIQRYFPAISLSEKLRWATSNGAESLGMIDLGSFVKGKKPGLVQIENVVSMDWLPEKIVIRNIPVVKSI